MNSRFAESMILRKIASPKKILISLQIGIFITFIAYAFYISGVANGFKSLSPNSDEIDYQNPVFIVTENPLPINFVRKAINYTNVQTTVYNEQLYGPLTNDHPVIIVQVHNRIFYLNYLIASLADVKGINKALLIFSHDIYNEEINTLIQNIKFCKVLQIFYPLSLQAFPDQFPGRDPRDCPRNADRKEALKMKCINADQPDSYGHYREASYAQTKHHWFWKINYIFDKLHLTRKHNGSFIFLEEDHFALPDLLQVEKLMQSYKDSQCKNCDVVILGAYPKIVNFATGSDKIEVAEWISSRHNMGMVIDRILWKSIKACTKEFCNYDDYNWDWSLMYISRHCMSRPMRALTLPVPRVFHIGECGVHHKSHNCLKNKLVDKITTYVSSANRYLFPSQLKRQSTPIKKFRMPKINGGWGDSRDHALCIEQVKA